MHKIKPNFLIVGAAKAGTTALYYYLKQHPEIGFPDLKEPKYFSSSQLEFPHNGIGDASVDKFAIKDWDQYLSLFEKLVDKKMIGEVSPDYLFYHDLTAPLIKEKLGDIPIIIILRNPTKRAFSAYMYLKRDSRENLSFEEALKKEDERLQRNWDFIWGYKKGGLHYEQVKTFLNYFKNVKIVLQEDLREDTVNVLNEIYSFLGVNPDYEVNTSIEHNPSGLPKNGIAKFLLNRNNILSTTIREVLKSIVPRSILEKVASRSLKKESMNIETKKILKNYYDEELNKLEKLLKKDLKHLRE